jgi:hypothetical protein
LIHDSDEYLRQAMAKLVEIKSNKGCVPQAIKKIIDVQSQLDEVINLIQAY